MIYFGSHYYLSANQLKAEKVDLHKPENRKAHKTDEYEIKKLILRRGQAFDVTVTFNREFSPQADVIILQFVTGNIVDWPGNI